MMASQQNFINTFQMNQLLYFKMLMTPEESLAPWCYFQNRNQHDILYKKGDKKTLQKYRPISTQAIKFILLFLKNLIQETLDTIIDEHQSETIKNRII